MTKERKELLADEFTYYLGQTISEWDASEIDDFLDDFDVSDEELDFLRTLRFKVVCTSDIEGEE